MSNNTEYKHAGSWKNSKEAFRRQLAFNKKQLEGDFPPHWNNFVRILKEETPKRVVDIGCGAGCYYPICRDLKIDYIGYDYSTHAVDLAKAEWGGNFAYKCYQEITPEDIREGDLVVANALADVLPNGDKCIEHLLSIGADELLIQRVRITESQNYFKEYQAYDIMTYEFYHNRAQLMSAIQDHGYELAKVTRLFSPAEDIFDIEIRKPNDT